VWCGLVWLQTGIDPRLCVSSTTRVCHSKIKSVILPAALAPHTYVPSVEELLKLCSGLLKGFVSFVLSVREEVCCEITETPCVCLARGLRSCDQG
jgi:hypothetical protein